MLPENDFKSLKESLITITEESGKQHAMALLRHGLAYTTMDRKQFDEIFIAIQKTSEKETDL